VERITLDVVPIPSADDRTDQNRATEKTPMSGIQPEIDSAAEPVQSHIEPVEVAVLLSVVFDGISRIRPDLQMVLDSRGIDRQAFSRDVAGLIAGLIANTGIDWDRPLSEGEGPDGPLSLPRLS
jgi:hypothetical protein